MAKIVVQQFLYPFGRIAPRHPFGGNTPHRGGGRGRDEVEGGHVSFETRGCLGWGTVTWSTSPEIGIQSIGNFLLKWFKNNSFEKKQHRDFGTFINYQN